MIVCCIIWYSMIWHYIYIFICTFMNMHTYIICGLLCIYLLSLSCYIISLFLHHISCAFGAVRFDSPPAILSLRNGMVKWVLDLPCVVSCRDKRRRKDPVVFAGCFDGKTVAAQDAPINAGQKSSVLCSWANLQWLFHASSKVTRDQQGACNQPKSANIWVTSRTQHGSQFC